MDDTNSRWPRQGHYTVQDIRALPDEIRVELIVEILSPSTRRKDFIVKTRYYEMAGVREYWIVDPPKENVLVFFFEEDKLPFTYSFDDKIPVRISGGKYGIDFRKISEVL